jgi:hypothetical protein
MNLNVVHLLVRFVINFVNPSKVFLTLALAFQVTLSTAQTILNVVAIGSCADSVKVTQVPSYPNNAYNIQNLNLCQPNNECCTITFGGPMGLRFWLQRFNHGTGMWEHFAGPQTTNKFTGLPGNVATYRVRVQVPKYISNTACVNGFIDVYDIQWRHLGYAGTYEDHFSNIVIVGQPTGQDNQFTFVDGNGILLFGNDPSLPIFDAQEDWKIDVSASKNYNQWLLNMWKKDPPDNLPWASYLGGWQLDGPPANPVIDIAHWWKFGTNNIFEPGETYVVQWVATNKDCANWNVLEKEAYICPSGWSCRFGMTTDAGEEEVILYPNPVATSFSLSGSRTVARLELLDSYGRQQATWSAGMGSYDLPFHFPSGVYYLRLFDGQNAMLKTIGVQVVR